ncbi:putative MATE family efflux protein [Nitrobacteraceae bacterium AZCC 1564]
MASRGPRLFTEGPIGLALVRFAIPVMLGNLLQTGYQLTDAFWVGRLGAAAVAAVSLNMPVMFLVIAAGAGFGIAGATLCTRYAGAGDHDMVNHVAAQTMMMVALISAIFALAGYAIAPHLIRWLGVAPDVYANALSFMRVSFFGVIFVFLYAMFQALMRGVGQMRMPLIILVCMVVLNFTLDPLFIYGAGPLPPLGVTGAAFATLLTQALAATAGIVLLFRGRNGIKLTWANLRPDFSYIKRAFLLGLPGSVELSARGLGPMAMSFLVAGFGTQTLAAYGVGANVLQFITVPAMALSMSVSTLVGQNIGAGSLARAERAAKLGILMGLGLLSVVGLSVFIFAPAVVAFFVPADAGVIAEGAHFIRMMCLTWGGIGMQLCVVSAFRASGNMMAAMIVALVSQCVFQLPLAYVLSKVTPLQAEGIWWSFPIANVATAMFCMLWFARGGWQKPIPSADGCLAASVAEEEIVEEGIRP